MGDGWVRQLLEIQRRNLVVGALTVALLAGTASWMIKPERHAITIYGLGEPVAFETTKHELGAALEAQGIAVGEHDVVQPALSTSLRGESELRVTVHRAVAVSLLEGDQESRVESAAVSVRALLEELNVALGEKDVVSIPLDSPLVEGMQIRVVRRVEQIVTAQEEMPFETVTRQDPNLRLGTTEVVQAGEAGLKEVRRRVLLEDGREVRSEVVEEKVVREPVHEVVAYGTQGVVSRGGQEFRYTQELTMTATGYTAGKESNPDGNGLTYTGDRAVRGVVAVDPRVIPLYTRLYIEGYGPAIALDIGGAIKGNKIDLCFDTVAEALEWGIRPVKVYILSE
ncbi:MAG: G5 domain-containing protein [Bacillota bacterium]